MYHRGYRLCEGILGAGATLFIHTEVFLVYSLRPQMSDLRHIALALVPALSCAFATAPSTVSAHNSQGSTGNANTARTPVLVELFTSEGCSSCPPADALLARLEQEQPIPGAEVIALEEHVDNWDELGWVDPFSGSQWTLRQQDYAAARRDRGVYTPQMIINGQTEFVGSREHQARQVIAEAASQLAARVTVTAIPTNQDGAIQCRVTVGNAKLGSNEHADVWLAVTERGLHSAVRGGENSGLDVRHGAVLRSLRKIGAVALGKEPAFTGDTTIKLDRLWKRENLRAVAFVQEKRSRHILGAAATPIEQESASSGMTPPALIMRKRGECLFGN
jgi:hypothetical protein